MLPEQSKLAWSSELHLISQGPRTIDYVFTVVITVLHVVAISSTVFRLCHRIRNRQLWWDDYVTIIPLMLDCVYVGVIWMSLSNGGTSMHLSLCDIRLMSDRLSEIPTREI